MDRYCPHCQKVVTQGDVCPDGHPGPLAAGTPPQKPVVGPDVREAELNKLRSQLSAKQTSEERRDAELAAIKAGQELLLQKVQMAEERARKSEITAYRERRLRELKEQGVGIFDTHVSGNDEAGIEESIKRAIAEYQRAEEYFKAKFAPKQPEATAVETVVEQRPVGHQTHMAPGPAAFPRAPNAQAPVQMETGQEWGNQVKAVTTQEAVRSGDYAKNRQQLMQQLRQGGAPPMGAAFANSPRYGWSTVQVPQALPTPQAVPPHMAQQAPNPANFPPPAPHMVEPSPMQPQVLQQQAPVPLMMPQPGVLGQPVVNPAAYLPQPPQPQQPVVQPGQQIVEAKPDFLAASGQAGSDTNTVRSRAISTARQHLATIKVDGHQLGSGGHPMNRNSAA